MEDQEGLVLQGCGGDPQEWLDGINDLLTQDGILIIRADRFRTQERNRQDARERLVALIAQAAAPPPPPRRPTKPTKGSQERRIAAKKRRSVIKSDRGRTDHD